MSNKEVTIACYDFEDLTVKGLPSTAQEYDELAGRDGACYEAALSQFLAHVHQGRFRSALIVALEKATGLMREQTTKGEKTVISEKDGDYIRRLSAHLKDQGGDLFTDYATLAQETLDATEVTLTKLVRSGLGSKPAAKWVKAVQDLIEAGKFDGFCSHVGIDGSTLVEDGELTEDGAQIAGNAFKKYWNARQAEIAAQIAAQSEF